MNLIKVNVEPVISEYNLTKRQGELLALSLLKAITNEFYATVQRTVSKELNSTRSQYLAGLNIYSSGKYENTVVLTGVLPTMLEKGASAFDIKAGLLKGSKAKMGKNGYIYTTVPFRLASSGAGGFSSSFSTVMPEAVYEIAKNLQATVSQIGQGTRYGESLKPSNVPEPYNEKKVRQTIQEAESNLTDEQLQQYTHKNSIYDGIIKQMKVYEKANQAKYNTFRRVSEPRQDGGSAVNSWIHKGFQARNFLERSIEKANIAGIAAQIKSSFLAQIK